MLSVIWRIHWRFAIGGFPFSDQQLVTRAMSQFAILKRGRLDLDCTFNRLRSVSFGSQLSQTCDSNYIL
jgi:hypothetical protein